MVGFVPRCAMGGWGAEGGGGGGGGGWGGGCCAGGAVGLGKILIFQSSCRLQPSHLSAVKGVTQD